MTLEKAIEILTDQAREGYHFPDQQRKEASRLGVEALIRVKDHREECLDITFRALPGETKE